MPTPSSGTPSVEFDEESGTVQLNDTHYSSLMGDTLVSAAQLRQPALRTPPCTSAIGQEANEHDAGSLI